MSNLFVVTQGVSLDLRSSDQPAFVIDASLDAEDDVASDRIVSAVSHLIRSADTHGRMITIVIEVDLDVEDLDTYVHSLVTIGFALADPEIALAAERCLRGTIVMLKRNPDLAADLKELIAHVPQARPILFVGNDAERADASRALHSAR